MKAIALYLWQLPQNLLALLLLLFFKESSGLIYKGIRVHVCSKLHGSVSLGNHIFVKMYPHDVHTWNTVKHEWGHTRQSRICGPLYLVVIGLPSLVCAVIHRLFHTEKQGWTRKAAEWWYFNLPWEEDADIRGKVDRWTTL